MYIFNFNIIRIDFIEVNYTTRAELYLKLNYVKYCVPESLFQIISARMYAAK